MFEFIRESFERIKRFLTRRKLVVKIIDSDTIVNKLDKDRKFKRLIAGLAPDLGEQLRSHVKELFRDGLNEVITSYENALVAERIEAEEVSKIIGDLEEKIIQQLKTSHEQLLEKIHAEVQIKNLQQRLEQALQTSTKLDRMLQKSNEKAEQINEKAGQILRELHLTNIFQIVFLILGAVIGLAGGTLMAYFSISAELAIGLIVVSVLIVLVLLFHSFRILLRHRRGMDTEVGLPSQVYGTVLQQIGRPDEHSEFLDF